MRKSNIMGASVLALMSVAGVGLFASSNVGAMEISASGKIFYQGMVITKDGETPPDDGGLEVLTKELETLVTMVTKSKTDMDDQFKSLTEHYAGKKSTDELAVAVKKHAEDYAEMVKQHQVLTQQLELVKKEIDVPAFGSDKDKDDVNTKASIELQRRTFIAKGGLSGEFEEDLDNLVDFKMYKRVVNKLMRVGLESKKKIVNGFNDLETKAFEASSLDIAFFSPEMLGLEVDCNIECAELLDLYGQDSVSRTNFMYPRINDYGAIGEYGCDATCDAPLGPEGNIQYLQGQTYDFRGVFCFQRKVLVEANYDLLSFMIRSAQRSHRINRNAASITGLGENEPLGWLTADCFTKLKTPALLFTHQDFRRFLSSAPVEYGPVVATMHQNMFGYLAAMIDTSNRFIFGDGQITFSPDDARERIRISNCLPDATADNTLGSAASPFVANSFIAAAGNWDMAYRSVSKRPMFMEQYEGGSNAWCVKYQFGAEDGGFVACCPAARTLYIG